MLMMGQLLRLNLSFSLSIHLSFLFIYPFINQFIYLCIYPSIYLSRPQENISFFVCLLSFLSILLFYLSIFLSYLSIYQSIFLSRPQGGQDIMLMIDQLLKLNSNISFLSVFFLFYLSFYFIYPCICPSIFYLGLKKDKI